MTASCAPRAKTMFGAQQDASVRKMIFRAYVLCIFTMVFCVNDPAGAARRMVEGGFTGEYDYALQTLKEVPYNKWRDYDPEDAVRFYALRLREAGMIKSTPNKIIAQGTDWRFFNELKRELKG